MRGRDGFNLVEVTLAMLVMAVGLLSVFSLFPADARFGTEDIYTQRIDATGTVRRGNQCAGFWRS